MAEKSFPWTNNGTGDGTAGGYAASEWTQIWRAIGQGTTEATGGVFYGTGDLVVTGTASPLTISVGQALVFGRFYHNDAALNLNVTTPTVGTTGGRVVLRMSIAAQTVRAVIKMNTNGVATIPALQQDASIWEIPLASFTITTAGVISVTQEQTYLQSGFVMQTANIGDAQITLAKMADNAVDDTKVGNRVPQFRRREGGSATNWNTPGTTNYTPTGVRQQAGAVSVSGGFATVTFPEAFSAIPLVFLTPLQLGSLDIPSFAVALSPAVSTTGFAVVMKDQSGASASGTLYWLAIGPE